MPITKDEASDLKSCIDRLVVVKLEQQLATFQVEDAERAFAKQFWKLQAQPIAK